jgi:hypothetical protein
MTRVVKEVPQGYCCGRMFLLSRQEDVTLDKKGFVTRCIDLGVPEVWEYEKLPELTFLYCPYCTRRLNYAEDRYQND